MEIFYAPKTKHNNILEKLKEINDFNIPIVIHTIDQNKRNYYMKEYKFDEYLEKPLKQAEEKKILSKLIK